ncbi:MAG: hypothetical protein VYE31_03530 [Pseudomonadota bacterium]|nr:hypothetical protein [Pseudomonadota bacterium]
MVNKISNVSHTLIINTFEGFYYKDSSKIEEALKKISESYNADRLLNISREIAKSIRVEILNESTHIFKPFGDSGSFLVGADIENYNTGAIHLKESHITFHTYLEDTLENFLIIRFELHICSCADENIFLSLPEIFNNSPNFPKKRNSLFPHLIGIDYLKRGSTLISNHKKTIKNIHNLTHEISDKAFGDKYIFIKKSADKNNQQNVLIMKEKLIERGLYSLHSNISNDIFTNFLSSLSNEYAESFLNI